MFVLIDIIFFLYLLLLDFFWEMVDILGCIVIECLNVC